MIVRPITADDAAAARTLVAHEYDGTRFLNRKLELLESAYHAGDDVCLVAVDGALRGLLVFSEIGGAAGVARISCLAGEGPGRRALVEEFLKRDDRLAFAEMPDDPAFRNEISTLEAAGFVEESSVSDFSADDVPLRILVRRRA